MVLTREIAHTLFNLLRDLSEWGQCDVMRVLVRYVPSTEDEVFDILVGARGLYCPAPWRGAVLPLPIVSVPARVGLALFLACLLSFLLSRTCWKSA